VRQLVRKRQSQVLATRRSQQIRRDNHDVPFRSSQEHRNTRPIGDHRARARTDSHLPAKLNYHLVKLSIAHRRAARRYRTRSAERSQDAYRDRRRAHNPESHHGPTQPDQQIGTCR